MCDGVDEQLPDHHDGVLRQGLTLKASSRDWLGLTGVAPDEALRRIDRLQDRQLLLGIEDVLDVRRATATSEPCSLNACIAEVAPPDRILTPAFVATTLP